MQPPYYRCNSDGCGGYDFTVRSKTLLEGSRLRLRIWFQAIWYFANQQNGVTAVAFQKHLHLGSNHTALKLLKTLRLAAAAAVQDPLSGSVDVDEYYLEGKKTGEVGGRVLVLIAVQAGKNSKGSLIRVLRVNITSTGGLVEAVAKLVRPGSKVFTDAWPDYDDLRSKGYEHGVIRESANLGGYLLPKPKRVALLLQRWLAAQQGGMNDAQLDYYLKEFAFRFNRHNANSDRTLFKRLLELAVSNVTTPVRYEDWATLREPLTPI